MIEGIGEEAQPTMHNSNFERIVILALFVLLARDTTVAQVHTGTIVVVVHSKDKAVMAADSRATFEDRRHSDNECKIVTLGDNLVFAAAGVASDFSVALPIHQRFETAELARRAFIKFTNSHSPSFRGSVTGRVAEIWANDIAVYFQMAAGKRRDIWLEMSGGGPILSEGFFLGIEPDGALALVLVELRHVKPTGASNVPRLAFEIVPVEMSNELKVTVIGLDDVVAEIIANRTGAAKAENRTFLEWRAKRPNDAHALIATRLIDLTIAFSKMRQQVGGPIDVVELRRGGGRRWIQCKEKCQ